MWSLHEEDKQLEPLKFSNGKTQKDIVREVIDAVKQGHKVVFIHGSCGTGKSGIALNLARHFGKTSIVVPIKSLQEQYIKDYTDKKFILKENSEKLKISPIVGRQNFKCKYLEENSMPETEKVVREKNTTLFDTNTLSKKPKITKDFSCDNSYIPCKIEIKEKNLEILKDYIRKNTKISIANFDSVHDIRRMSIAPICPYWSPIIVEEFETKRFKDAIKKEYLGINKKKYSFYIRKSGCPYYEQYLAYTDSDVILFNSLKYRIESVLGRKPQTELEIIDECDEFLDSFSEEESINLNKLLFSLGFLASKDKSIQESIDKITDLAKAIKNSEKFDSRETYCVKDTLIEELLHAVLENSELLDVIEDDENNYLLHLDKVARIFYDFINETFFSIEKRDNDKIIHLVTTNLEKPLKFLTQNNKILVFMSGTLHSESILKNIFGIEDIKIIQAETKTQGQLIKCKYGYEMDCSYESFKSNQVTREQYLKSLSKCIACSKQPTLVHVTAFSDLPTDYEKNLYSIDNLPSQSELLHEQSLDPLGKRVHDFKNKKTQILFTTKCNRGIDFPGDTCNSIVITRFPYPNISGIFWKILKKNKPEHFMRFYMDKARRELLQRIYRGLRSKNDKVYLLSPDIRVLEFDVE